MDRESFPHRLTAFNLHALKPLPAVRSMPEPSIPKEEVTMRRDRLYLAGSALVVLGVLWFAQAQKQGSGVMGVANAIEFAGLRR